MKSIYFTPGPSALYPTVEKHIHEAMQKEIGSLSHRSKAFEEIFSSIVFSLKKLWNIPQEYNVFFVGSGTEAMERIIENTVKNYSFHFVNGSFSDRFFDTAVELGKNPQKIEVNLGSGFNFAKTKIPKKTELLCFTQNETSTGVMLPTDEIAQFKKLYPEMLIAIDTVSSAPYPDIDFTLSDIVFFSVQKMFGLPAGLGVMIVSPKAMDKAMFLQKKNISIGSYHNFLTLAKYALQNQTPETPPVLEIYLLDQVLKDFLKIGIEKIRKETDKKANLLYNFFDTHPVWESGVADSLFRSPTVIVGNIGKQQPELKKYLEKHHMIVGNGYGPKANEQIRIANFPAVSIKDVEKLLNALEAFH